MAPYILGIASTVVGVLAIGVVVYAAWTGRLHLPWGHNRNHSLS